MGNLDRRPRHQRESVQGVVQVSPVDEVVRCRVLDPRMWLQLGQPDHLAVLPTPEHDLVGSKDAITPERLDPPTKQQATRVWGDLDAGTDLGGRGRVSIDKKNQPTLEWGRGRPRRVEALARE